MDRKKFIIIGAGAVSLIVIVVIIIASDRDSTAVSEPTINNPPAGGQLTIPAPATSSSDPLPTGALTPTETETLERDIDAVYQTDKDFDGLSDEDEKNKYHTNPDSSDSDDDGILDADEIAVYKTNPLVADTDGDTFIDGYEVSRGFNPLGPGKLSR